MYRTRRANWLWFLSLGLALCAGIARADELDSDGDGLSDAQELSLGFDAHSPDSSMDGISDFDAYQGMNVRAAGRAASLSNVSAGPTGDADGDGIRDFLETYGYYNQDHALAGVKRIVPGKDWREFAAREPVAGYPVYKLATRALTKLLIAQYDSNEDIYVVDVASAYDAIRSKFINSGIPELSALITGSTAQPGSIASIMSYLVTGRAFVTPTDANGEALPVYFTHPLRASTDSDPYTDYAEALGIFNAGRPPSPADHPLIAALPSIRAKLLSYRLTQISTSSVALGHTETITDVLRQTSSYSHGHGFAVSASVSHEVGAAAGVKWEVETTQSNQWSVGTSVTTEQRNSHASFTQRTDETSNNCFAKLGLTVQLENVGSALASNVSTSLNVFLGDTLWRTVPVTPSTSNLTLQPQGRVTLTVLGQGSEDSCLTLNETNYLEQGGLIGIETAMGDATISIYDPTQQVVVQSGSWAVYRALIEQELARLDLNVTTTSGVNLIDSFWVVAAQSSYPNLSLSVEDVLARAYRRFDCAEKTIAANACFETGVGDIALTEDAAIDFSFYTASGELLSRMESRDRYAALPGDDAKPLTKQMAAREVVSIVERAWELPQFAHLEVVNRLRAAAGSDSSSDALVRSLVRDFFGVAKVYFCTSAAESSCTLMTNTLGSAANPVSGQYEMFLPQYSFSGTEYLKAVSVSGRTALQTPEAFFLALGEELYRSVDEYGQRVVDMDAAIDRLAALRASDGVKYNQLISSGLMLDVETATSLNDARRRQLQAAQQVCSYSASSQATAQQLAARVSACLDMIRHDLVDAFNVDIPVYNPQKLPFTRLSGAEQGWKGDASRDTTQAMCKLAPGEVMVGVDLGKSKDADSPTAWVRYRSFDAFTGTLSAVQEMRCGPDTGRERTFSPPFNSDDSYKDNIVLDVGARIGAEKIVGRHNGNVTRLCVSYRLFNFRTAQFEGSRHIDCNGNAVSNPQSTEAETGRLQDGNATLALSALIVGGGNNDTFGYMRGLHLKLSKQYDPKPYQTLVSGGKYRLETSQGKVLAVTGLNANSRALTTAAWNGSDSQIWKVLAVNDREFRLVPQSYEGFITRSGSDGNNVSVVPPALDDALGVNYLQHWRLERLVNGSYLVQSVLDGKVLSESLTLGDFSGDVAQEWVPVRIDDPRVQPLAPVSEYTVSAAEGKKVSGNDYECTSLDVRDEHGKPRYVSSYSLAALRHSSAEGYLSQGRVYLDPTTPFSFSFSWPQGIDLITSLNVNRRWKSMQKNLQRYVLTDAIRVCGYARRPLETHSRNTDMSIKELKIEALSNAGH